MKSKKPFLIKNYFLIKETFGDLVSIPELAIFCDAVPRTIQRYLEDGFIVACHVEKKKRAVIVDSILRDFKKTKDYEFHSLIKNKGLNKELYYKEQDFIAKLFIGDYSKFKISDLKKVTFQNKTLICMVSLNNLLNERSKSNKRVIL